ncbi:GNAT family N-acetyltransferase [Lentzea sp. NPDC051838]|uniref:GNAT family N-acetyltransferase n=1 Tax=Lentzea sp. NPDC051838 TaxID=3154849 RepID=UPI003431BFCA
MLTVVEIRRLGVDDIPECMKLITDRGWTWTPEQWELMLTLGPGLGAFDGGQILGTALSTPYPEAQAISGVLVGTWAERRGVGTALMSNILDISPTPVSVLYATSMGEPLYARLGFHPVGATAEYSGQYTGPAVGVTRPAAISDISALVALDHVVSGYTRPQFWESVLDPATPYTVRMSDVGVIATRPNPVGFTIGPIIAPSASVACDMIADVAACSGQFRAGQVRVDTDNADVGAFLVERGLEKRTGGCSLMVRGAAHVPGNRSRYFAPASHALG